MARRGLEQPSRHQQQQQLRGKKRPYPGQGSSSDLAQRPSSKTRRADSEAAYLAKIKERADAEDSGESSEAEADFSDEHGDDLDRGGEDEHLARIRARAEANDSSDDAGSDGGEDDHQSRISDGEHSSEGEDGSDAESNSSDDNGALAPGDAYDDSDYDTEDGGDDAADGRNDRLAELPLGERLQQQQHGAGPKQQHRRAVVTGLDPRNRDALKARMAAAAHGKANGANALLQADSDDDTSDTDSDTAAAAESQRPAESKSNGGKGGGVPKRANKNRPAEMSSKRAVGRHREVVDVKRRRARDPRFDAATGNLNYDMFRKSYGFLEEYQNGEIDALKKAAAGGGKGKKKKKGVPGEAERAAAAKVLLGKMQQERAERKRADATRAALSQRRRTEAQAVAKGKAPYFMKARDRRALALETRYEELRRDGKVQKFVEKKRKRNAAKDRRWMPAQRQHGGGDDAG